MSNNQKPDFTVKAPIQRGERNTYWHSIGAAWQQGDSITLQLDSLPLGNRLVLFKAEAKEGGAA